MTNKQQWLAPEVVASSTVSGRSVENLFLTLPSRCKYEETKIAFGVKSTHRFSEDSPYTFVGFDFQAQEGQVAAMFAESLSGGVNGTDAFNYSLIKGNKEEGTDYHSMVAKEAGIDRYTAKGVNFSILYGAGKKTAANAIIQGLPDNQKNKALDYAGKALKAFKGKKQGSRYEGGLASNYFNYVYRKSDTRHPTLDVFGQTIPKCLDTAYIHKSGSPAQINGFIQAACSTNGMLSAFLIFADAEINKLGLQDDCRYSISIHDN